MSSTAPAGVPSGISSAAGMSKPWTLSVRSCRTILPVAGLNGGDQVVPSAMTSPRRVATLAETLSAHHHRENRLLDVQAVLGFVPYDALAAVDHVGGDFLAAVRGKAVQEDRIR